MLAWESDKDTWNNYDKLREWMFEPQTTPRAKTHSGPIIEESSVEAIDLFDLYNVDDEKSEIESPSVYSAIASVAPPPPVVDWDNWDFEVEKLPSEAMPIELTSLSTGSFMTGSSQDPDKSLIKQGAHGLWRLLATLCERLLLFHLQYPTVEDDEWSNYNSDSSDGSSL